MHAGEMKKAGPVNQACLLLLPLSLAISNHQQELAILDGVGQRGAGG
jgi:hypothetical protein